MDELLDVGAVGGKVAMMADERKEDIIGELAEEAYSFVGATSQIRLLKAHAPRWAECLKANGVDAALLVAA